MLRGLLVFAFTYVLVATRNLRFVRLDRPAGALAGAVLAVLVGAVTPDQATRAVDHTTIVLLFGVMGMGAFLAQDGFLDRAGGALARRAKTPRALIGVVVWGSGLFAAIVTNDAACVLLAPLVVTWVERYKLPRLPTLLALATGANTGSVATLIGNPQNMLCGSLGHLGFARFSAHMLPVAIVALAVNHGVLLVLFRRDLATASPELRAAAAEDGAGAVVFSRRASLTLAVLFATVAGYVAGGSLAFTALGGFVLLLVLHRTDPAQIWARIDWSILLFFSGLFIAVDAVARSGAAAWAFDRIPLLGAEGPIGTLGWLRPAAIFLVGSNLVTNVPFILIVRPEMGALPDPKLAWELLAMASTFAGNLTILGSVANVIVAEKAQRVGGLSFWEYARAGVPVAVLTTGVGTLLLTALTALR